MKTNRKRKANPVLHRAPYGKLGRCLQSLDEVVQKFGRLRADGTRYGGINTAKQRKSDLKLLLKLLHEQGYPIVSVNNLKPVHLKAIADGMVGRGYKAPTHQKYFTHLARLCDWVGKPGLIGDPRQYYEDPSVYERHYAAEIPETLPVPELNVGAVLRDTYDRDWRCGIWLETEDQFGLRTTEAIRHRFCEQENSQFITFKGVKNRRWRSVPIETDAQRDLLRRARELTPSKSASLIPPERSLKQSRNRFRNVMKSVGLTKGQLGATPHTLRHGYARRTYFQLTGQRCPAEGGTCEGMSRHEDREARLIIADRLGHSRESITCAYLGPILT